MSGGLFSFHGFSISLRIILCAANVGKIFVKCPDCTGNLRFCLLSVMPARQSAVGSCCHGSRGLRRAAPAGIYRPPARRCTPTALPDGDCAAATRRCIRCSTRCFPASLLDGVRQFGEAFRLEHRVAPAERHVCECIGKHLLQNFIGAHPASAVNVPRLRIVAARTPVGASGRVNGGTETGTVHRGIF